MLPKGNEMTLSQSLYPMIKRQCLMSLDMILLLLMSLDMILMPMEPSVGSFTGAPLEGPFFNL
jgi:hypothetical protein